MTADGPRTSGLDRVRIPGSAPAPEAAPTAPALTTPVLAGWGARIGGRFLSGVVPTVLVYGSFFVLAFTGNRLVAAVTLSLWPLYLVWQWSTLGRTGANMARRNVGVCIVDEGTLTPIGFGRAAGRELSLTLMSTVSCGVLLVVNLIVASNNPRRQGWHDRWARSVAVRSDSLTPAVVTSRAVTQAPVPAARGTQPVAPVPPVAPPVAPVPKPVPLADTTGLIDAIPGAGTPAPVRATHVLPTEDSLETATRARPPVRAVEPTPSPPSVGPAGFELVVDDGTRVALEGLVLVGRDPAGGPDDASAQLVTVQDAGRSLSKTHAAFGVDGGRCWVEDRGSTNGVTLVGSDGVERVAVPFSREFLDSELHVLLGDRQVHVVRRPGGVVPIDGVPSFP